MNRFLIVGLLALLVIPVSAHATKEGATKFATSLADKAIVILEDENLSQTGKQNKLEKLFTNSVDLDWVARFVLGKHWRVASKEQQKEYLKYYKTFIIRNFTGRLGEYSGQDYTVKNVRQEGDPGEYLLTLELTASNEPPIFLDYRIRKDGSRYRIFDIIIEGVSLITTQRSEFNSVVSRNGLDFLIDALKKRAEKKA